MPTKRALGEDSKSAASASDKQNGGGAAYVPHVSWRQVPVLAENASVVPVPAHALPWYAVKLRPPHRSQVPLPAG